MFNPSQFLLRQSYFSKWLNCGSKNLGQGKLNSKMVPPVGTFVRELSQPFQFFRNVLGRKWQKKIDKDNSNEWAELNSPRILEVKFLPPNEVSALCSSILNTEVMILHDFINLHHANFVLIALGIVKSKSNCWSDYSQLSSCHRCSRINFQGVLKNLFRYSSPM